MDYMSNYSTNMDFVVGRLELRKEAGLYEVIHYLVEDYKKLIEKVEALEKAPKKEKKRGRPRKKSTS